MKNNQCKWQEDEDGNWQTDCGETYILIDGTPTDNGMKFCCYCGKPVVAVLTMMGVLK